MAEWFVGRDGQQSGPFSAEQLRAMRSRGELSAGDLVWKRGMPQWIDCEAVAEISGASRTARVAAAPSQWNPYQAPTHDVDVPAGPRGALRYADYLPRVGATILDSFFVSLIIVVPALFLGVVSGAALGPEQGQAVAYVLGNLLGTIAGIAYFVGLEASEKQGTFGKQIVGIKVTDLEGRRISVWRALGRYFAKILTGCSMGIGWLLPLFTEKRQTLHDMVAGCLAVKR